MVGAATKTIPGVLSNRATGGFINKPGCFLDRSLASIRPREPRFHGQEVSEGSARFIVSKTWTAPLK